MRNYFDMDIDKRVGENNRCIKRMNEKPRSSLHDAVEYDIGYVNEILNEKGISISDRQNIADVVSWLAAQLINTNDTERSFEKFLIGVMGEDWYQDMIAKWLQLIGNEMAEKLNCKELYRPTTVYYVKPE